MSFKHTFSKALQKKLEHHYQGFDSGSLGTDPVLFPHRYRFPEDIEIVALLSSVFAYGNVKLTGKMLESILKLFGNSPYLGIKNLKKSDRSIRNSFSGYRYYSKQDVEVLIFVLRDLLQEFGTVGRMIQEKSKGLKQIRPKETIAIFNKEFARYSERYSEPTGGLKFMFPDPSLGSACKRFNLFLRWMVRKDEIDFGLWKFMTPADLIIPVDTHISAIALRLGLTESKAANWKTAVEITESLRLYDAEDPVRFDFALCHIGMWGIEF